MPDSLQPISNLLACPVVFIIEAENDRMDHCVGLFLWVNTHLTQIDTTLLRKGSYIVGACRTPARTDPKDMLTSCA